MSTRKDKVKQLNKLPSIMRYAVVAHAAPNITNEDVWDAIEELEKKVNKAGRGVKRDKRLLKRLETAKAYYHEATRQKDKTKILHCRVQAMGELSSATKRFQKKLERNNSEKKHRSTKSRQSRGGSSRGTRDPESSSSSSSDSESEPEQPSFPPPTVPMQPGSKPAFPPGFAPGAMNHPFRGQGIPFPRPPAVPPPHVQTVHPGFHQASPNPNAQFPPGPFVQGPSYPQQGYPPRQASNYAPSYNGEGESDGESTCTGYAARTSSTSQTASTRTSRSSRASRSRSHYAASEAETDDSSNAGMNAARNEMVLYMGAGPSSTRGGTKASRSATAGASEGGEYVRLPPGSCSTLGDEVNRAQSRYDYGMYIPGAEAAGGIPERAGCS
ncbi:hypothetical protein QBC44DRAFT_356072 [Cladorrhinum sp. PSN332]|nr:hypothetical protein QBC44DRAFT_356072 [Cladorrhinum sp. PSN332]